MEFDQTFAIIQTMVNKDKAKDALETYKKSRFPWIESSKKKQQKDDIKRLMDEVKRGALIITPQIGPKMRSRLKTKVVHRHSGDGKTTKEQKAVYTSIGSAIPK